MRVWKPVKNYEGLYEVSNLGEVRSLDRTDSIGRKIKGRLLKPAQCKGYQVVGLHKKGKMKQVYIHRLVAEAFIGEPPKGYEVNHIDENKANNCVDNLEYLTHLGNMRYGTGIARMKEKQGKAVVGTNLITGEKRIYKSLTEASKDLNCNRSNIGSVAHGRFRQAAGYKWEFCD